MAILYTAQKEDSGRYRWHTGVLVCAVCLMVGCSINPIADSEAGNPTVISSSALINLPTSIANNSFTLKRASQIDKAENIYLLLRLQNYLVNELINGDTLSVRWLIDDFIAQLPWYYIIQAGSYSLDSLTFHFEATYEATRPLPYEVSISYNVPLRGWEMKAAFNGSAEYPEGWIYFLTDYTGDFRTDSLAILVSFEKSATHRVLDIAIDQKLLLPVKDLAQSFQYSWYESLGIVHISGIGYFPYLDSILRDTTGYCYTYTTVVDTQNNLAIVNLGVPPASYADTTLLFTEYGIANAYGKYYINYTIPALDDSSKMILATSYKDTLSLVEIFLKIQSDSTFNLRDASNVDTMTTADLALYLELNRGIIDLISDEPTRLKYMELLWILKLKQPVYFNASGYVSNGEIVPSGFEGLAAIPCNRARFIPRNTQDLQIVIPQ